MKKGSLRFISLLLALVMVAGLCACGSSSGKSTSGSSSASGSSSSGDGIVIGGTFTLSGSVAHAGESTLEGAQLAVKYVNEELGGVNGKQVSLKYYDDEWDESKIPNLYEKLINQDKVDLLVSPYTSPFLAAAPVCAKYNKEMFTIAADSYSANEEYGQTVVNIQMDDSWKGGMWWKDVFDMFAHFDEWNTKGLAKPKTGAILNLEIAYGHEIAESVEPFLKENGFDIVYDEYFDPGVSDWTATVTKLQDLKPDIVFAPQYFEDTVTLVQKMKEMNYYAPYMIMEGMSWDIQSWPSVDNGGLDPSIAKLPYFGYSVYKEKYAETNKSSQYLADYVKQKYNQVPGNDIICGFMAVELACEAANDAGSTDTDALVKALTTNTYDLAGYQYTMNESGGNGADFNWGVGQYIPEDITKADSSGTDWYTVWPKKYANHDIAYPFTGWGE